MYKIIEKKIIWLLALFLLPTISCASFFHEPTPVPETLSIEGVTQIVPPQQGLGIGRVFWSPDSAQLIFTQARTAMDNSPSEYKISIVHIYSGEIRLLEESNHDRDVVAWLPDGRIAIFARGDLQEGVWLINADGNGPQKLPFNTQAIWSLDGDYIAFERFDYNKQTKNNTISILVQDFEGKNEQEVFQAEGKGINLNLLQWSPDGNKILFVLDDGMADNLYILDHATKKSTKLSQDGYYGSASWSPDGTLIIYTYRKVLTADEYMMLYVMRSDGSCPTLLILQPGHDIAWAMWSPDGRWIAFTWNRGVYLLDTSKISEIELLKESSTCPNQKR